LPPTPPPPPPLYSVSSTVFTVFVELPSTSPSDDDTAAFERRP